MRHAGPRALEDLQPLLVSLRALQLFREPRPGIFTLKGRAALHFHEDPSGVHADLRLAGTAFERVRVETAEERAAFLDRLRPGAPA